MKCTSCYVALFLFHFFCIIWDAFVIYTFPRRSFFVFCIAPFKLGTKGNWGRSDRFVSGGAFVSTVLRLHQRLLPQGALCFFAWVACFGGVLPFVARVINFPTLFTPFISFTNNLSFWKRYSTSNHRSGAPTNSPTPSCLLGFSDQGTCCCIYSFRVFLFVLSLRFFSNCLYLMNRQRSFSLVELSYISSTATWRRWRSWCWTKWWNSIRPRCSRDCMCCSVLTECLSRTSRVSHDCLESSVPTGILYCACWCWNWWSQIPIMCWWSFECMCSQNF